MPIENNYNFKEKKEKFKKEPIGQVIKEKLTNVVFGGASPALIYIKKDYVCKILPTYEKRINSSVKYNNEVEEIKFYQTFTNDLILQDITPHIVGLYEVEKFNLNQLKNELNCVSNEKEFINKLVKKTKRRKKTNQTKTIKFGGYNPICDFDNFNTCKYMSLLRNGKVKDLAYGIYLEKCDLDIQNYLTRKLKQKNKKLFDLAGFIHQTVFQFLYTMEAIYSLYPNFIHNDMFLRNVLCIENKANKNEYFEYQYHNKKFYLPAKCLMIKINDFGFSLANDKLGDKQIKKFIQKRNQICDQITTNKFETSNKSNQDTWNFMNNFYQMWYNSLQYTPMENKEKHQYKKQYLDAFSKYFDTKLYNKVQKEFFKHKIFAWSPEGISELENRYLRPSEYLNQDYFDQYSTLPYKGIVIHTFKIK